MKKYYREQRTFLVWDAEHIIGYLNEERVQNYTPDAAQRPSAQDGEQEEPEVWPVAYGYEGTHVDGGTIMPCTDPTNYGDVANAIIRSRYSESDEMAIHRHYTNDPNEYAEEWQDYNDFCEAAKVLAKDWLGIE